MEYGYNKHELVMSALKICGRWEMDKCGGIKIGIRTAQQIMHSAESLLISLASSLPVREPSLFMYELPLGG